MRFEKVSLEQYKKDCAEDTLYEAIHGSSPYLGSEELSPEEIYDSIKLPKRATKKAAGYDFYAPHDFKLNPGDTVRIATGIRVILDDDKFLMCAPRSGHGFKARIQLDNTVGIIDADYSESDNEGHIMLKLTNDSKTMKSITVNRGDAMMQAIILQYFKVDGDNTTEQRNGGFGSTDNK